MLRAQVTAACPIPDRDLAWRFARDGARLQFCALTAGPMLEKDFRLVTLGQLTLCPPSGRVVEGLDELNARRRKVALLALLALRRRPISRDTLLEMFWGAQDEARARH